MRRATSVLLILLIGLAMLACAPALNWRSVPLDQITVLLPCKPDRAQRPVQIGPQPLAMEVVGCEAAGALFAASRMEIPAGMDPKAVLAQWYTAALVSLGDMQQRTPPAEAMADMGRTLTASGTGKRPDGSELQARYRWQLGAREIVLLAVYAPQITEAMTEPFLVELKLP